eukprot:PITA_33576
MIITSWNIRGLNSKGKQRYLKERLKKDKPSIMIIQETKMKQQQIQVILDKSKSKFEVMAQDAEGSAGGRYFGTQRRSLLKIGSAYQGSYLEDLGEKRGGIQRQDPSMDDFNDLITNLRLVDTPTTNGVFTWNNRRGGRNQIASKLDRFLLSEQVLNKDVFIEARILPGLGSDHWPICLEIDIKKTNIKKPFRFESFWLRNPDFLNKLEEWWNQSQVRGQCKMHTFQLRLKELKQKIRKWNKEDFGNIF